ncbi:MAG: PAS domain-containing protein [Candidatus Cloacimonadales bacterium]
MDEQKNDNSLILEKKVSRLENEIDDLKNQIKRLKPADERLRSVISASELAVIDYLFPISYHLYHCPEFAKILGYQDDENFIFAQELPWFLEQIEPEDLARIRPKIASIENGKLERASFHFRFRHQTGKWIYLKFYCSVKERDQAQKISRIVGVLQDITSQQEIDNALIASESRYHGIFENSPLSLWEEDWSEVQAYFDRLRKRGVSDFKEYFSQHQQAVSKCVSLVKILDVNKQTLKIHAAHNKKELLENLSTVFTEYTENVFIDELVSFAEGNLTYESENIHRTLDGKQLHIVLKMSVVPGYEKDLSKVIVSMMDITDKKKIEAEKEQAQQDLIKISDSHRELENIISICLSCDKVRRDDDFDKKIFAYRKKHPEAEFMHYVCPECKEKMVNRTKK